MGVGWRLGATPSVGYQAVCRADLPKVPLTTRNGDSCEAEEAALLGVVGLDQSRRWPSSSCSRSQGCPPPLSPPLPHGSRACGLRRYCAQALERHHHRRPTCMLHNSTHRWDVWRQWSKSQVAVTTPCAIASHVSNTRLSSANCASRTYTPQSHHRRNTLLTLTLRACEHPDVDRARPHAPPPAQPAPPAPPAPPAQCAPYLRRALNAAASITTRWLWRSSVMRRVLTILLRPWRRAP